jgi:hypothetical protein
MSKQTAVQYLIQYMMNNQYFVGNDLADVFEQAKEMEREQIEQAYIQGCWDEIDERMESRVEESCKRYYIETYKGGEQ